MDAKLYLRVSGLKHAERISTLLQRHLETNQSVVGSLMSCNVYKTSHCMPYEPSLARFSSKPKRVLLCLNGISSHGIVFRGGKPGNCMGYSDADWAGDMEDRKSTSGYLFQIAGGPVSWRSKKQNSVALSTAKAEYVSLSSAAHAGVGVDRRLNSDSEN